MGELVERHVESMINEVQEMKRVKIYSQTEIDAIIKACRKYEFKVNGPMKNKEDYIDFIKFLQCIVKDVKQRRSRFKIDDGKRRIEARLIKRIQILFEIAIQKFLNDFDLSLNYFKFCKDSNYAQSASSVIQNMLKTFSSKIEVWQVAASWFMTKDIKQALSTIHKGLSIHPLSLELYIQAIELELLAKEKEDCSGDPEKAQEIENTCYKKIETYIDIMVKNINNYQCLVVLLETLNSHSNTTRVQNKIIETLMIQYCDEVEVWRILAEREKKGLHYPPVENSQTSSKFRLTRCFEKFEEGLSKICVPKVPDMWALYLDFLIELNQQNDVGNNFIRSTLLKKLNEAQHLNNSISILNEKYYVVWVQLLTEENEILKVLNNGLKNIPESLELWKLKMKLMAIKDDVAQMNQEFKKGLIALKEKGGPLWAIIIRYHILSSPVPIIEIVFEDAVKQPAKISDVIKPEYIEWVAFNKDIHAARTVYQDLAKKPPFCKDLHLKMFKLELYEIKTDPKYLELPLKLACEQFGHEDADVWIALRDVYYKFNSLFRDAYPEFDINKKVTEIRKLALEALKENPILLADFQDKYDAPVPID